MEGSSAMWIAGGVGLVIGLACGALVAWLLVRRGGGGRSAAQLKVELDEYRGEVGEHFDRTSEIFRDLTVRYRDLYEHLATGANSLCTDNEPGHRLETSVRELLTASSPVAGAGVTESQNADRAGSEPGTTASTDPGPGVSIDNVEPLATGVDAPRPMPEAAADAPVEARKRSA